ncbi:MAG: site-specific integrase [archaeon]
MVVGRTVCRRVVVGCEEDWKKYLFGLSFQDLSKLGKLQKEVMTTKYYGNKRNIPLSRNVYRVFADQDLLDFFSGIKPNEVKMGLAFFLQLTGGFRIGEISPIKLEHIDFKRGVISLITEKANVSSDQPIPALTLEVLQTWIEQNKRGIELSGGYVFFSKNFLIKRDVISKDTLRNYFQKFRARANLCSTYAERNDVNNPKHHSNRQLCKLSSHSFRRSYLTALYQECKKKELVAVLARHKKRDVTDQYIYFTHAEQLELVNKTFNNEVYKTIAKELIEKTQMHQIL